MIKCLESFSHLNQGKKKKYSSHFTKIRYFWHNKHLISNLSKIVIYIWKLYCILHIIVTLLTFKKVSELCLFTFKFLFAFYHRFGEFRFSCLKIKFICKLENYYRFKLKDDIARIYTCNIKWIHKIPFFKILRATHVLYILKILN